MAVSNWVRGVGSVFQRIGGGVKCSRKFKVAGNSPHVASVDVLEERLLLTADFGDAPDTTAGTGANNYQTLASHGGPSHVIDTTQTNLFLGGRVDGEAGTQQSAAANLDNLFAAGGRNDEDGVMSSLDLTATIGSSPRITLSATNTTGTAVTLYGWIDYNHNGVFENATERASISVPTVTTPGRFTLQFPKMLGDIAGGTYARFRLSSDAAAANATGAATGGEVEDYRFQIMKRVNLQDDAPESLRISSGVNGGPAIPAEDGNAYAVNIPIGDLDGNGVVDLASGTSSGSSQGLDRGAVYILFRDADGTVSRSVRIASGVNGGPQLGSVKFFGTSIANLGDIDGDGVTDIAVGAKDSNSTSVLYILRLNVNGTAKSFTQLTSGQDGIPAGFDLNTFREIEGLGDLDGDGNPDIAVADFNANGDGKNNLGAVHILRLNSDGTVKDSSTIKNSATWNPTNAGMNIFMNMFGRIITTIGDQDGDGVVDLAVTSEVSVGISGDMETYIILLHLNGDGTLKDVSRLAYGNNGVSGLDTLRSIYSMTSIGDIDGNGVGDIAVSGEGSIGWVDNQEVLTFLKMNSNGTVKGILTLPNLGGSDVTSIANIDGSTTLGIGMPYFGYYYGNYVSSLTMLSLASMTPATTPPAAPVISNLAGPITYPLPTISWTESSNATEYEIWLKNISTGEVLLKSVFVTGTEYTPTADLAIGKYAFSIRALNEVGPSAWSRSLNFTITPAVYTSSAWPGMNRRPALSWGPLGGATHYDIWVSNARTPGVAAFNKRIVSNTGIFTLDEDLPDGDYRFQIRGVAADGTGGAWSSVKTFTIDTMTEIQQVTQQFTLRPRIEWEVVYGAAAYDVYISPLRSGSVPIQIHVSALDSSAYIPTSDLAAGEYRAWVRAVADDGSHGVWSAFQDFSAGTDLQVEPTTNTTTPNDAVWLPIPSMVGAKYVDIWIDDPSPGLTPAASGISPLVIQYSGVQVPKLSIQGKYRLWVRIVADDGTMSRWSSAINLTVQSKPSNVKLFTGSYTHKQEVTWEMIAGAVDYEIQIRNIDSNLIRTFHPLGPVNWLELDSLTLLGRYEISVRAISSDGTLGLWGNMAQTYISVPIPNLVPFSSTSSATPLFQWNAVGDAVSYDVVVRNQTTHSVQFTAREVKATNYISQTLAVGNYELWVIANGQNGARSEWASQQFETKAPPKPRLLIGGPGIQAGTTGYVIDWIFPATADHFDLWISNSRGVLAIRDMNVPATSYTLSSLLPKDYFHVWVRAVYADGTTSPWSNSESFVVY